METNSQPAGAEVGADGLQDFLVPHPISGGAGADLRLLRRAIREDWPMTPEVRALAIARMEAIIRRETATIPGAGGEPIESDAIADRNAIAATGNLIAMRGQDQRDRHKVWDLEQADRHHREGSKVLNAHATFMLVSDGHGTRPATANDIRAAAGLEAAEAPSLPAGGMRQPGP